MAIGDDIRARRIELKLSQADLGKLVKLSQAAIDKIESGKTQKSRFLPEILAALGMGRSPAMALASELKPASSDLIPIKVVGKLKAGEFIAVEDLGDWDEPETILDIVDSRFPNARHMAFEVEGDSMNALKPRPILPGDRLSAISYEDVSSQLPLRDGMIVAVERTRHGGLEREWSVKQLEIYEDRVEFHPRSTNPRHKPIVVPRDNKADDGVKVEIIAIIRRAITEFNL